MTTQLDSSIGMKREASYAATGVPDHFPEFLTESLEWKPAFMQGHGFRQGSRTPRNERRALGKNFAEGDIELECVARGIGIFFEALLGQSVSTGLLSLAAPTANGAITATPAGALAATTAYVRTTYTTAGGESLPAPETSLAIPVNNVANVASPVSVSGATGWNVYVSNATGAETKQNTTPIALGTPWVEPTSGLIAGAAIPTVGTAFVAYQQNFTMATSDPINSYTIQKGIPLLGGGAVQAHTLSGAVCTKGDLTSAQGDIVKLKTSWNAKKLDTTTAYAAPSYIANNELFTFVEGAITVGGTVVAPTTTTLASGGTVAADITDFSLSLDNKLNVDGYTYGAGGTQGRKPVLGEAAITGKLTAEYDSTVLEQAYLNQTALGIVLTFTSTTQLQTGIYNTLQVYIPTVKLEGELPKATNGVIRQSVGFTGLDGGTGVSPITIVLRTLDTAV